ncbi:MAG TPA: hypothetical protein VIM85_07795, partial [Pseudomonadales bacterium]
EYPLACGVLGGFGGFLSEKLRAHDYQLGRYNCYNFLKNHFGLPKKYSVVKSGYRDLTTGVYECGDSEHWQIIPLISEITIPKLLDPPDINRDEFEYFIAQCHKRTDVIFTATRRELGFSGLAGILPKLYWWAMGSSKVKKIIRKKLAEALMNHGLSTEDYSIPEARFTVPGSRIKRRPK